MIARDAWFASREIARRNERMPLRYVAWLPLQHEFLSSSAKIKQIRAGNQTIGKSWAALAEVIGRCIGEHPLGDVQHDYRQPPIEAWVICASWSQSVGIQKKLWALLPKDKLSERTRFDEVAGFAPTKQPVVEFLNGSIIRIKTCGQDAIDFAGATIACVLFDEPPKAPRMYTEAMMRLEELGGTLLLSYTPINAPVDYLKELVDRGQIEDHWRPLTPAEMIPVGHTEPLRAKDGRLKDQTWIDERIAKVPSHEIDVVVHGEWEGRAEGAYFGPVWREEEHVADVSLQGKWRILIGIDHGHQPGKQCAVLILARKVRDYWQVYVLDEYVDTTGKAKPEDDARAILAMIGRHGFGWHQLDEVRGDRIHMKGTNSQKSNRELERHIADALELPSVEALKPRIETAKRGEGHGAGSVEAGTRWLFQQLARPGMFAMHPRVERGKRSFERYVKPRDDADGCKDWLDGLRYGLDRLIFEGRKGRGPKVRFG